MRTLSSVSVDKNAYLNGDTATITATPYSGYELTKLYVDGAELVGTTKFTVIGNHTVSAVFTKIPVHGGTEYCRIGDISVFTTSGAPLQELPKGSCLASIPVTSLAEEKSVTILIASYTAQGQFMGCTWVSFEDLPVGVTVKVTTPIDNAGGTVAVLKAYVVSSVFDPTPLGNAVCFGV